MMRSVDLTLPNPVLQALQTTQRRFALTRGMAWKYPREVAPFAALEEVSEVTLRDLYSLMEPGEATYVPSEVALSLPGLRCEGPVGVLQFTWREESTLPEGKAAAEVAIEALSCADAEAMMGLTAVAFPGFFRRRTCEMGRYYGVRRAGALVAMCGERMIAGQFREISGLCTHPETRGRGLAQGLVRRLLREHREAGDRSYLHVASNNENAIAMYERMGFKREGEYAMFRVTRDG